jgi:lysophospholipase L1-like esterase
MGMKGGAACVAAGYLVLFGLSPLARVSGQDAVATRSIRLPLVVNNNSIRVTDPATPTSTPTGTPVRTATQTVVPTLTPTPGPARPSILRAGIKARIMPIGDSLTRGGEDVVPPHFSYRGPLQKKLRDTGYQYDFVGGAVLTSTNGNDFAHEGHAGYTIGGVDPGFDVSGFRMGITDNITRYLNSVQSPDVILLLVGINDVFVERVPGWAPDRLEALVNLIKTQRPDAKIVVASLLRLEGEATPRDLTLSINARARFLGERSDSDNVFFADLATVDLQAADYSDGVHLSPAGAAKVADAWYAVLTR